MNKDEYLQAMKQAIDESVEGNEKIQQFLSWVNEKSRSVQSPYKTTAVSAFYVSLCLDSSRNVSYYVHDLIYILDSTLKHDLEHAYPAAPDYSRLYAESDYFPGRYHSQVEAFNRSSELAFDQTLSRLLYSAFKLIFERSEDLSRISHIFSIIDRYYAPNLKQKLEILRGQLPDSEQSKSYKQWWQKNGQAWIEKLRAEMIEHRNIGHNWKFSNEQKQLLQQYYDANELLVNCINSDCYISRSVHKKIEETLLLPITEIEKRKGDNR